MLILIKSNVYRRKTFYAKLYQKVTSMFTNIERAHDYIIVNIVPQTFSSYHV